ncbi:MAG: hypothetical protein V4596_03745 [Bdellovibrionota bacterium]
MKIILLVFLSMSFTFSNYVLAKNSCESLFSSKNTLVSRDVLLDLTKKIDILTWKIEKLERAIKNNNLEVHGNLEQPNVRIALGNLKKAERSLFSPIYRLTGRKSKLEEIAEQTMNLDVLRQLRRQYKDEYKKQRHKIASKDEAMALEKLNLKTQLDIISLISKDQAEKNNEIKFNEETVTILEWKGRRNPKHPFLLLEQINPEKGLAQFKIAFNLNEQKRPLNYILVYDYFSDKIIFQGIETTGSSRKVIPKQFLYDGEIPYYITYGQLNPRQNDSIFPALILINGISTNHGNDYNRDVDYGGSTTHSSPGDSYGNDY